MEKLDNLEQIKLPEAVVNAIISDLCIGLLSHDKIAKKYNTAPDTITKISRLFGERIGQVKKEIRDSVLAQTKTWATESVKKMQNLASSFLDEASLKKKREKASLSQVVISFATLVDKIQLLSGGVTSRTETVKMTSRSEMLEMLTGQKAQKRSAVRSAAALRQDMAICFRR